jgi:hypothetical protein
MFHEDGPGAGPAALGVAVVRSGGTYPQSAGGWFDPSWELPAIERGAIITGMPDRSVPGLRAVARRLATLAVAAIAVLPGCREAPISFAAVPGPALSDTLALAERRGGRELSPAEFAAFLVAHDAYLEAWRDSIRREAEPLAREVRAVPPDELRQDAARIRRLVSRQKGVLARFAALDRELAAAIAGLGPDTAPIAEAFAARRALDRTNAVLFADGGAVVADLRDTVEEAMDDPELEPLGPEEAAAVSEILARHDREVAASRERAGEAAVELTRDWRELEDSSPVAETLVDPALEDRARDDARNRIAFERLAAARGRLETALTRLADRDDATVAEIEAIAPGLADSLRERQLRLRARDAWVGSEIRRVSFLALVASRSGGTGSIEPSVRDEILRIRREFLAADRERLQTLLAVAREGLVPGVFEPGGPGAGGRRFGRIRTLDGERQAALGRFRDSLKDLVGEERYASLEALPGVAADDLPAAIASIAGEARTSALLRSMPADFLRDPAGGERKTGVEDDAIGTGERRETGIFLPPPLGPRELDRFADRCGVDDETRSAWVEIVKAHLERREAIEADEDRRVEPALDRAVRSVTSPVSGDETSRAIAAFFAVADSIRTARLAAFEALVDDLAAASARPVPANEVAFWKRERAALAREIRWSEIPGFDGLAISREARVDPVRLVGVLDLPAGSRALCLELADEFGTTTAAEDLRRACAESVRRMFAFAIAAQVEGRRMDEDDPEFLDELAKIRAPAASAGLRLAGIHRSIVDRVAAALPRDAGRRLREAFLDAAFPGLLELDDPLANALDRLRLDPALGDETFPAVLVNLDERDEARDRAIDGLREWKDAEGGDRVDGDTRGEDVRRTEPRLAYLLAMRREADLRAARAIRGLLDDAALARHPRLSEGQRPPRPPIGGVRSYD